VDLVRIEKIDNVYIRIIAEPSIKMEMSDHFKFKVPGYQFMPAYKNKMWSGDILLFNAMTGLIYAGLLTLVQKFCADHSYKCEISKDLDDKIVIPDNYANEIAKRVKTVFEVRDYQAEAVNYAISNNRVLFLSPTASGKSFIIYLIMCHYLMQNKNVLIVVPTSNLVDQMASDFVKYSNRPMDIHKIRGGLEKTSDSKITVSTWQSIHRMPKQFFEKYDVVFGDEAHNFKAKSLTSILDKMPHVKYRFGLTGTLDGENCNRLVLTGLFGPVYEVTKTKKLIDNKVLSPFRIKAIVLKYPEDIRKANKGKIYQDEVDFIVRDNSRNLYIRNLAWNLKGNTLVLFQYVDKHGKILYDMLKSEDRDVYFIHGGVKSEVRESIRADVSKSTNSIICASYGTFSMGINIPELDNLIFASPIKGRIRNLQSIGRVLRKSKNKDVATLYDIVDDLQWKNTQNFAVKHFIERVKAYNEEGFEFKIYNVNLGE